MRTARQLVMRYGHMPRYAYGAECWLERCRPRIQVLRRSLPSTQRGFAVCAYHEFAIVLNSRLGDPMPWATMAHELAHIEMGCTLSFDLITSPDAGYWEQRIERHANAFAGELLIPWEELWGMEGRSVEHAAAELCVPERLIVARFGQL